MAIQAPTRAPVATSAPPDELRPIANLVEAQEKTEEALAALSNQYETDISKATQELTADAAKAVNVETFLNRHKFTRERTEQFHAREEALRFFKKKFDGMVALAEKTQRPQLMRVLEEKLAELERLVAEQGEKADALRQRRDKTRYWLVKLGRRSAAAKGTREPSLAGSKAEA